MEKKISKKIYDYYQSLFEQYGFDPKSVGWGSKKGKQSLRFEILCQIGQLSNSSILDVGCGFGDLYGYLRYRRIKVRYHGVDINQNLLNIGKKFYPGISLDLRDFEKKKFHKKFDWILASGITSHGSTYSHLTGVMKEMFRICKKGFAMNFVSDKVDYKTEGLFYSSPEKILSITKSITNRFVLRHDYMPFEFTLYIYKDSRKTTNNIFKDYIKNSGVYLNDEKWHPSYKQN